MNLSNLGKLDAQSSKLGIQRIGDFLASNAIPRKAGVSSIGHFPTLQCTQATGADGSCEFGNWQAEEGLFDEDKGASREISCGNSVAASTVLGVPWERTLCRFYTGKGNELGALQK